MLEISLLFNTSLAKETVHAPGSVLFAIQRLFSTNKKTELLCFQLCLNPIVFIKQIRIFIGQMK